MTLQRAFLIAGGLWLATGLYTVRVDEQAVVRRFGAVVADHVAPGLHVGLPWGIDRVDRVRVREQKRLSIGFELPDLALGRSASPGRSEFLTGDQNLVNVQLLLQYTVREPRAYLFHAANATETLRQAAESAVAATVAGRPVDELLTTGKLAVQDELVRRTQEIADAGGLGIGITAASIQSVTPPLKVAAAFRDVASAREDRDRLVKEAESYANAALPAAQGEASRMREEALAYRDQKTQQARGDAARFTQAYEAYRLSPDVTRARLYLEAVEEIMPRLKVVSVDRQGGKSPLDLNLLPAAAPRAAAPNPAPAPDSGAPTNAGPSPAAPASGAP